MKKAAGSKSSWIGGISISPRSHSLTEPSYGVGKFVAYKFALVPRDMVHHCAIDRFHTCLLWSSERGKRQRSGKGRLSIPMRHLGRFKAASQYGRSGRLRINDAFTGKAARK
jgi:hypothetical protein